ncbi:hypothetical protein D3C72_1454740 [compost metagenome]
MPVCGEIRHRARHAVPCQIVRGCHQHQRQVRQRLRKQAAVGHLPGAQGQVEAFADQVDMLVADADLQCQAGMARHQDGRDRPQQGARKVARHADAQLAHRRGRGAQHLGGLLQPPHQRRHAPVVGLPLVGQHAGARRAMEQLHAQPRLQPRNALGHRRRRGAEPPRGGRERARFHGADEGGQAMQAFNRHR